MAISGNPANNPAVYLDISLPKPSPMYPKISTPVSKSLRSPNSFVIAPRAPITTAIPATNANKPPTTDKIALMLPQIFEANVTRTIAPLRATKSRDRLPIVSIDVLKPNLVSSADIPTTSAPSAAVIPTMIHTLLIIPGAMTGDLDMIVTALENASIKVLIPTTVVNDVRIPNFDSMADIAPISTVNTPTIPTMFQIPLNDLGRMVLVLAIFAYIAVNTPISKDKLLAADSNLLLSIRPDDNIASAAAIAAKTPPIAIMLFVASAANFDKPSRRANTAPITPTAPTARHILSSGK